MTYILNEAQEAWLKALESGEYNQCVGKLCTDDGYCPLGVACEIAKLPKKRDQSMQCYSFYNEIQYAPREIVRALKLRDSEGEFSDAVSIGDIWCCSIVDANDSGITFPALAAFVRANPTALFVEL